MPQQTFFHDRCRRHAIGVGNCHQYPPSSDSDDDDRAGSVLPDNIDKLKGIDINNATPASLASVGNPTALTATITSQSELMKKIFVIYNVGTKKFLTSGTWWGTHATLGDSPKLFWLQRRNEVKTEQETELRYPDDGQDLVISADVANPNISDINAALTSDKAGLLKLTSGLQAGSKQGVARSHATYSVFKHVRTSDDGTETVVKDFLGGAESYTPDGKDFGYDVSDFDFDTDKLIVTFDTKNCYNQSKDNKPENVLSIGNSITDWDGTKKYNLHMYYHSDTKTLEIDYTDKDAKYTGNYSDKSRNIISSVRGKCTITLSKSGISVTDLTPITLTVPYSAEKAGDIVKLKYNDYDKKDIYISSDNKYVIDEENGHPFSMNYEAYTFTQNNTEGNATWFITSKVTSATSATKDEGKYLGYAPYDGSTAALGNGSKGCFIDRNVASTSRELGQWSFEPVTISGETGNIYNICLRIPYVEETGKIETTKDTDGHTTRHKFYLEADNSYVTGKLSNQTASPDKFYHIADTEQNGKISDDYNMAELHTAIDATDPNNCWKIISLDEYVDLIGGAKSEMLSPVELSFLLSDPNFERENGELSSWQTDESLKVTDFSHGAKLCIGYDGFYKVNTSDTDYSNKGTSANNNGSDMVISHSQYMSALIQKGGRGRMYQDVAVYYPGWYEIRCQGMTNVDAKLFVQRLNGIGDGATAATEPIVKDLKKITSDEITALNHASDAHWPYDSGMPMYNAAVMMNDEDLPAAEGEEKSYLKYRNYVLIYIDKVNEQAVSRQNPAYLRFGIDVQNGADGVAQGDERTFFDNFHLLFGGKSEEPNLILNENETDLDYIDNYMHVYENKPMHLYRTFTDGVWNTIMLPVSLTKEQFESTFGTATKLARLNKMSGATLHFLLVEQENDDDVMLEAFKPYIIKPQSAGAASTEYTATLINKENPSLSITKTCPDKHFLVENVTLPYEENTATGEKWYAFGTLDAYNATVNGEKYKYMIDAKSSAATADGAMHCFGTLCKTYEKAADGGNEYGLKIISGRPRLDSGNAYVMKKGTMYRVPEMENGYGLKGFRCWFEYISNDTQTAKPGDLQLVINGIGDGTDTIDDLKAADGIPTISKFADGIYTIDGQRIGNGTTSIKALPKGLYIVNGKKFIKQ